MPVPEVTEPLLRLRGVAKHFGAVEALAGADLEVWAGEVTALCGDNGAGKSVLIKCIAGIHEPDAGEIFWEGRRVRIRTPRDASALGIEVVYQDLALCDNLDVVQNMFLGRERLRNGLLDEDSMERAASATLSDLRVVTLQSVRRAVAFLSGGQRQSVAVAKAVMWNSKLVILDEPTAALGVAQTRQVLDLVRRLADQGLAVIVVSHNLNDVFAVADRLAILRLGRMVGAGKASEFDPQLVVELMTTGRSSRQPSEPPAAATMDVRAPAPAQEPSEGPSSAAAPAA
jgi:D-xylose transport system permease protein